MPTMTDRLSRFRRLVLRVSARLRWAAPTLARLTLGWIFLQSGWGKLHNLEKVIGFFTELGIPAPQIQAPFAAFMEFACGLLMLLGLATRFASLPLIGIMIVAIGTAKRADIHELSDLFGTSEYLYIVLALWLGGYGAGPLSVDYLVAKRLEEGERPLPAGVRV
jgi:putative oxidoreductase